jgi:hypothetical protein
MIGKNIRPGVIGGITKDKNGAYVASDIDSTTGNPVTGGDIPVAQSLVAMARTLGSALGIPDTVAAGDFIGTAGGKVVGAAIV